MCHSFILSSTFHSKLTVCVCKMGTTISAIIRIRNFTNHDIISVQAYDIDSFDFGNLRPDKVFDGISVPANTCVERTVDFSTLSSNCPFTMRVLFKDGSEDVFRLNYKCVFDDNETKLQHFTKAHRLWLKKTGPRIMEIVLENTEDQIENQNAEKLISDGCKLMDFGKYNEASMKFMEAAHKARDSKTIMDLQAYSDKLNTIREDMDIDNLAKTLNKEGIKLLKAANISDALKKFNEALHLARNPDTVNLIEDNLKIAKDAKLNQDAKKINQQGLILRRTNRLEAATSKFEEAIRTAVDTTLVNSFKCNKAETLSEQAEETLKEAWELEASLSGESIHHFAKAKYLFEEADSCKHSPKYRQSVSGIDCKLQGERYFRTAVQLEKEGSRLIDHTIKSQRGEDCKTAKDKYNEAWKYYREAEKHFEEGRKRDSNFDRSLLMTQEALHGIETILNELEKAELEIVLADP